MTVKLRICAIVGLVTLFGQSAQAQQFLNEWLDNGCSLVSAQVAGEVSVVLNCKTMVEAMRKSGKDFKGNPVPPEYSKNYGYTVVCVTEKIQPKAIGASVKYCLTIP
ncbi:MAG TPA: hypothetical protein VFR73_03270 [Hyphomicrobiaceae bacterium]|jgi:hypothetical protein|nr:hypothetical protein [Hyphomicrobiaceae bacterium]